MEVESGTNGKSEVTNKMVCCGRGWVQAKKQVRQCVKKIFLANPHLLSHYVVM